MERTELLIFLKTPIGKMISLNCPLTTTIKSIKEIIKDSEAIPPSHCWLMYRGKSLDEKNTLKDYNVQEHDTIHINIYLRAD